MTQLELLEAQRAALVERGDQLGRAIRHEEYARIGVENALRQHYSELMQQKYENDNAIEAIDAAIQQIAAAAAIIAAVQEK